MTVEIGKNLKDAIKQIEVADTDIVLLRGKWQPKIVQLIADSLVDAKIKTLLVVLPDGALDLGTISIVDFYTMLKDTEEKLGLNPSVTYDNLIYKQKEYIEFLGKGMVHEAVRGGCSLEEYNTGNRLRSEIKELTACLTP